jgi:hypothetical protein
MLDNILHPGYAIVASIVNQNSFLVFGTQVKMNRKRFEISSQGDVDLFVLALVDVHLVVLDLNLCDELVEHLLSIHVKDLLEEVSGVMVRESSLVARVSVSIVNWRWFKVSASQKTKVSTRVIGAVSFENLPRRRLAPYERMS